MFLNNVNLLAFVLDTVSVACQVGIECLYVIWMNVSLQKVMYRLCGSDADLHL